MSPPVGRKSTRIRAITCTRTREDPNLLTRIMERDNATQSHTCFLNQTKSDLLSNTECMYASAIVDTGASTSLLSMELEPTLINTQPSSARIQGFEGTSEIKGGIFGTGHMYIVSPNNQQPGFQLTTTFDTVRDLNSNLFSIAALYETHG